MSSLFQTGRVVGWLFVLSGALLALGLLLRIGTGFYLQGKAGSGWNAKGALLLGVYLLGLLAAGLLLRYGRRLLRGGHIKAGPGGKTII